MPTLVVVSPATVILSEGATQQLTATVYDQHGSPMAGQALAWTSLALPIATVDATGLVTAVAQGATGITASVGGATGSAAVLVETVTPAPPPDTSPALITIAPTTVSLQVPTTGQLTATVKNAAGDVLAVAVDGYQSSDTSIATVSSAGVVTAVGAGSCLIRAFIGTLFSNAATVTVTVVVQPPPPEPPGTTDGFAELLRVRLDTSLAATPSAGVTIPVGIGGDFQAALDAALPGDRIQLARGATYAGNFVLKGKAGGGIAGGWITIELDPTGGFLAEGADMTPTNAATYNLPRVRANSLLPALETEAVDTCRRYRLVGIEFDVDPAIDGQGGAGPHQGIIHLGDAGSGQDSLAKVPGFIYLDRCYVHGHATLNCRRGVSFNAASLAIVNSWVDQIQSTFDCQAIACSNGPGPHKIHHNHLEASTEVIAYGGANMWLGMNAEDIEITQNRITKPLGQWPTWFVKNLIEIKNGVRVLIEGNIMDHVPAAAQFSALVLWNAQVDEPGPAFARTEDIVVRHNDIRNVKWGINLSARYNDTIVNRMQRVTIRDNVFRGINFQPDTGVGVSRWIAIGGFIDKLWIEHNTAPTNDSGLVYDGTVLTNHVVRSNLFGGGGFFAYQMYSSAGQGKAVVANYFGAGSEFQGNIVVDLNGVWQPIPGNACPALADVGIVGDPAQWNALTVPITDLALAAGSPYKGTGTDGHDPGCDAATIAAAVAGVQE